MKRIASVLLVLTLIVSFATSVYAQTPVAKLGRGIVNTLTGHLEIPIGVFKTCKNEGYPTGLTLGLARGIAMGLYRTMIGLYELVTFPIPILPENYQPIADPPTLLTSETLEPGNPVVRKDFRPLSSEYEGTTRGK